MADMQENRQEKRYRVKEGAIAVIGNHANVLGQIIDISLSGLSFRYMDNGQKEDNDRLTILSTDQNFYLVNIPFETVSDFSLHNIPSFSSMVMRRRCLRFGTLTAEQTAQIKRFIARYASSESLKNASDSGNVAAI